MNLTAKTADKIGASYDRSFEGALRDLLRREGLAILTDEARRELIVKLGQDRRDTIARNLWQRNGGQAWGYGWSRPYKEWLFAKFRAADDKASLSVAAE